MRRPEGALARAEASLFAPGDPRRVAALRIGLGTVLALRLATGPYLELARQPAALFRPISFLHLLHAMPPPAVVVVLQVAATAAAVLAVAGVAARVTLPLAWAGALPLVAMTSSLGKVVHNDVLLLLCLVPLLPARTASAHARHTASLRASGRPGKPLRTCTLPWSPTGRSANGTGVSCPAASTVTACQAAWTGWRASANSRQPVSGHASMPATPQTTNTVRKAATNQRVHAGTAARSTVCMR